MSTTIKTLTDVRELLADLRCRCRATFVGDPDAFRCDEAIKVVGETIARASEAEKHQRQEAIDNAD